MYINYLSGGILSWLRRRSFDSRAQVLARIAKKGQRRQTRGERGLDGLDIRERTYGGALIIEADADAATIRPTLSCARRGTAVPPSNI